MSYADFLAAKQRRHDPIGQDITIADVHPMLHPWQRQIVRWACRQGRAAIFADCGLGKTFMQLEWARLMADTALIVAPLSVARQTIREATKLGIEVRYVRDPGDVIEPGIWITNYEMVAQFDPDAFGAVVLDESSILKNHTGATRNALIEQWTDTRHRLACTATPAPNDITELTNHAEFLGVMPRVEMLAAYFVHDQDGWRIKGHAVEPMHQWMATWAAAVRTPSDVGGDDTGYILPPLRVHPEIVESGIEVEGQLFATELGGVGGRARVRKTTMAARIERAVDLIRANPDDQWIVWCGLNDEAAAITRAVPGAINVEGSWSADAKADALERFHDGAVPVLVTKVSIAGFGMNFQNCHRMAFLGLGDSYEAYYQAIRRCWRFGQAEPVDVHVVVSELEQQIAHNVARKEHQSSTTADLLVKHSPIALEMTHA
jgi:superfamily II DNA or RNA helicase